jgi:uncharacterized protein (TIGR03000 family)
MFGPRPALPLRPALAALALLAAAAPAVAWPLGSPLYTNRYPVPPSAYGYYLDETNPTYFGGARYREFYGYGRGYGLANFPDSLPNFPPPPPLRLHRAPPAPPVLAPQVAAPAAPVAFLLVEVPAAAEVWLEGQRMGQAGRIRLYVSPPLTPGARYAYEVRARWTDGGREVEQVREVVVHAGDRVVVAFPRPSEAEDLPAPRALPDLDQP